MVHTCRINVSGVKYAHGSIVSVYVRKLKVVKFVAIILQNEFKIS